MKSTVSVFSKCIVSVFILLSAANTHAGGAEGPLYPPAKPPLFTLVGDGRPEAVVVVQDKASVEERQAAGELVAYVQRMSGAKLEVAGSAADRPAVILRVDPALNPAPEGERNWAGSRGYRLLVQRNRLHVIGSDPLSVLFGVYGLLERHLGVRWLWPGELGEVVPQQKTVRVGQLDETSVPDFRVRWVGIGDWALCHGANAMVRIAGQPVGVKWKWHFHTFSTLIPAEKYYDQNRYNAHPHARADETLDVSVLCSWS